LLNLQRRGEIGTFAPVKGQEAAQIGPVSCLEDEDWFVPSFRENAAALWRGADMADLFLTTAGWNEGINIPEGGRNLPNAVPVGSQLPHAVGLAYAERLKGEGRIAMVVFGDGATSEGDFHEALNFAALLRAPVVFLCQNNGWAISVPREKQTVSKTLAQKAHAYGLPAVRVDGNDALATREAMEECAALAREEGRPSMIEAVTYRMEVHTTADDPTRYRDESELEEWRERDPILRAQAFLRERSQIDDDLLQALETRIEKEIDQAWDEAKARMEELRGASDAAMFDHVFAEPPAELARQRAAFEGEEESG
jgi:pyruvate dehydrogenase E1 component alpha subunit